MIQQAPRPFEIALDIGHSSIGWAVFQNGEKFDLLGTGVVLFPADDCLAIKRRAYRRQRRHVRATRQRIERLKRILLHIGALTEAELKEPGCAWPWKLAAEVLSGTGRLLTWPELWDVLRWYAHNRGYDGNARWSRQEIDPEDSKKEQEAKVRKGDKPPDDIPKSEWEQAARGYRDAAKQNPGKDQTTNNQRADWAQQQAQNAKK